MSGPIEIKKASVIVYDLLGKEILSTQLGNEEGLNVSTLNNGMYFIEMKQDNYIGRATFIKN
ncbi:MAG: T9SS type A sorting domain-containing protein [Bacteroidetes bacterium]|nr:T9SS type A sorting domain-containing protein [Bacteroidota bacterium]